QVRFSWDCPTADFASVIEAAGTLPIPPYLHRETEESDLERYQTVYSSIKGSVAAPTAGLHFTEAVFEKLKAKHIDCDEVTLHVGAGTFKQVKAPTIAEHQMHAEQIMVQKALVEKLLAHKGKLIAVGTTSIRTLESLYWLGVKIHAKPNIPLSELDIEQWLPYQSRADIGKTESLQAILNYMNRNGLQTIGAHTKIIIVPGYQFRVTEGMFTNFHQPQSTLLLLVSAFIGNDWARVYQHALANGYRFLSYGDSNLYLK
ncbi:MAG: S-adenosylmethionine:tRNA ribosyltransferase-isomerase, partial [Mangrovibacterium sp.]